MVSCGPSIENRSVRSWLLFYHSRPRLIMSLEGSIFSRALINQAHVILILVYSLNADFPLLKFISVAYSVILVWLVALSIRNAFWNFFKAISIRIHNFKKWEKRDRLPRKNVPFQPDYCYQGNFCLVVCWLIKERNNLIGSRNFEGSTITAKASKTVALIFVQLRML